MEIKFKRSQRKGMLGGAVYVSETTIAFTPEEVSTIKKERLQDFPLYDRDRDGGPNVTAGYYSVMPIFMWFKGSVKLETKDAGLLEQLEGCIVSHLKEVRDKIKDKTRLDARYQGGEQSINLDDD